MKRKPYTIKAIVRTFEIAFLVGGLLIGCSRSSEQAPAETNGQEVVTLRLGYRPRALVDVTPVVIVESALKGKSIRVELTPVTSPPEAFARLNAGELDALAGMPTEAVFAQLGNAKETPRFVAYAAQVDLKGAGWVAVVASKDSGAKSLADLAGKTVASLPTDQANWLLRRLLEASGIPRDQVHVARYTTINPIAGLRSGEHAAVFGPEPANAMALAEGGVVLARGPLSTFLYDGGPVPVALSVATSAFVEAHPKEFAEFIGLVESAIDICRAEPGQVRGFFSKPEYGGLSPDILSRLELPVMMKPSDELINVTRRFVSDLVKDGFLKEPIDPERLYWNPQ